MKMESATQVGKAYTAFLAFNFKQKKDRLKDFDLKRWLKVVSILEQPETTPGIKGTGTYVPRAKHGTAKGPLKRKWTPAQRALYNQTIIQRKNGHA